MVGKPIYWGGEQFIPFLPIYPVEGHFLSKGISKNNFAFSVWAKASLILALNRDIKQIAQFNLKLAGALEVGFLQETRLLGVRFIYAHRLTVP